MTDDNDEISIKVQEREWDCDENDQKTHLNSSSESIFAEILSHSESLEKWFDSLLSSSEEYQSLTPIIKQIVSALLLSICVTN
jgi:transcription termination factor NusB